MVISGITINLHRKEQRRRSREILCETLPDAPGSISDMSEVRAAESLEKFLQGAPGGSEAEVGRRVLGFVVEGKTCREIAKECGMGLGAVAKGVAWVRAHTARWAAQEGLKDFVPARFRG